MTYDEIETRLAALEIALGVIQADFAGKLSVIVDEFTTLRTAYRQTKHATVLQVQLIEAIKPNKVMKVIR